MEICRASRKDIWQIIDLSKQGRLFNYSFWIYFWLHVLGWLFVIKEDSKIVGYYAYLVFPFIPICFLLQICLDSSYQKAGNGTEILRYLLSDLKFKYKTKLVKAHTLKPHVAAWLVKKGFSEIVSVKGIRVLKHYL